MFTQAVGAGEAKIVGLLIMSALLFGEPPLHALLCCLSSDVLCDAGTAFKLYAGFATSDRLLHTLLGPRPVCCHSQARFRQLLCADEKRTFTLKMTIGITMALIGFCMYSHTKIRQPPAGLPAKAPADPMHNLETESLLQEQRKGAR